MGSLYGALSIVLSRILFFFFFQAEDGIRDRTVTGVQTYALPISSRRLPFHLRDFVPGPAARCVRMRASTHRLARPRRDGAALAPGRARREPRLVGRGGRPDRQIGRASCRERGSIRVGAVALKKKE